MHCARYAGALQQKTLQTLQGLAINKIPNIPQCTFPPHYMIPSISLARMCSAQQSTSFSLNGRKNGKPYVILKIGGHSARAFTVSQPPYTAKHLFLRHWVATIAIVILAAVQMLICGMV